MTWPMATWAAGIVVFACLLVAAVTDVRDRIIPNRLVLAVMAVGVGLRLLADAGVPWPSLAIWGLTAGVFGALATYAVIGWGDAKMIAAVTLLVPPHDVIPLLLAIAIAGGVLAMTYLAMGRVLRSRPELPPDAAASSRPGMVGLWNKERAKIRAKEPMPYAVAVLGGLAYQTAIETVRCLPAISCWH